MDTDITVLLDRSGSMQAIKDDVEGGFKTFLEEQKKLEGQAFLTIVQFDSEGIDVTKKEVPIKDAKPLGLQPRGSTPLLDALGSTITKTGERLSSRETRRVLFVIITDGLENASKEYKKAQINSMITEQREKWNWEFLFLAANQDAIGEAMSLGIPQNFAMNYQANAVGTSGMSAALNYCSTNYRGGGSSALDPEARKRWETGKGH